MFAQIVHTVSVLQTYKRGYMTRKGRRGCFHYLAVRMSWPFLRKNEDRTRCDTAGPCR